MASAIFKDDNTRFFLIGEISEFWILRRTELEQLYNTIKNNGERMPNGCRRVKAERGTSLGYIIPKAVANGMRLSLEELVGEI